MSRVFLAEETALGRKVVIKVLAPELAAEVNVERFRREIQLAAKLQHPYIVPVLSTGIAGNLLYFTMPFVEGESVRLRVQRTGEFPVPDATAIMRDVLEALAYAHECGVVHRDIKPENVLLARNHAHVADFGVAKALSAATNAHSGLTSLGVALGTPAYMAPEQAMADPATDHRADLYALGAMAYEMLTGHQVFSARSPQAMLAAHATQQPELISKRRPNTPPALAALVMRLLEKHAADRPQSASEALSILVATRTPSGEMVPTAQEAPREQAAPRSPRRVAWIGLAIAIVLVAIGGFLIAHRFAVGGASAAPQSPSIAVMPFENMSDDPGDEYFSDGMTEELIDALSKINGLHVAARSSVFALQKKDLNPREVAKELGVTTVLEGTVRRAGNRVRISAQLVDASSGYSLWADRYDRDARDVFAIQDEISRAIVSNLRVKLVGLPATLVEASTENVEAHNLYLQGRFFFNKRTASDIQRAISLFEQAIRLDSTYAHAYAALSISYNLLSAYENLPPRQLRAKAAAAAARAIALDSTLADAHTAVGIIAIRFGRDWDLAVREFQQAITLGPVSSQARIWRSQMFDMIGKPDSAVAEMRTAVAAEPLSLIVNTMTGVAYYNARRYRDAEAAERKAIDLDSTFVRSHRDLGWALIAQRRFAEAEREFEIARRLLHDTPGPETAYLYAVSGRRAEAEAMARSLEARNSAGKLSHNPRYGFETALPLEMAMMHGALGNRDRAFYWLNRAYDEGILPAFIRTSPQYDSLRGDPRFQAYLVRLKLP